MKLKTQILMLALCFSQTLWSQNYDLVIVGGTPGGIMAAIEAARMGKTSVILERTAYIGGLPANGLGATDIATRGATTGLFSEFTQHIRNYYSKKYGKTSQQVKDCSDGFHFEPSVAEKVFHEMIAAEGARITVLTQRQFNFSKKDIEMQDNHINRIRVVNRQTGKNEYYAGRIFIDATYEGDLGAAAGVPFRIGREAASEYNEPGAGKVYEYWKSLPAEGTTGEADNAIQAYNYRLTLTDDPKQMVPIEKPKDYRREDYVSLIEDVWTGRTTWKEVRDLQADVYEKNRQHLKNGGKRSITPWDMWGIDRLVSNNKVPNNKVDANNQHAAFISTDLPEENWPWPTASWKWRDKFAQRLRDYTLGLFWFAQHDEALPKQFREAVSKWGLSKTEYEDNGYFPRQVYVREGRRFEGMYFFTAQDALPVSEGQRPPIHASSITASHYALDSHAAHKREEGRAHLDGFISYPTAVYTVPYGVIVPKEVDNLLLPVPVSGSHIGFSTLRMEPCWMALGQAAGAAASLAISDQCTVQTVDVSKLQNRLLDEGATLLYYTDLTPADSEFKKAQLKGLQQEATGWQYREPFRSEAVDREIVRVQQLLGENEKMATMFGQCFPNTLQTTVRYRQQDGDDDTFVITGDIPAMWLRDSGAQVWPYVRYANQDEHLRKMLRGVILCQLRFICIDPYANAFNDGPTGEGWQTDSTQMNPNVFERKYEIDSSCYPIRLAYEYWKVTGDTTIFGDLWQEAVGKIVAVFREQQRKQGLGSYRFLRSSDRAYDTLGWDGYGTPVNPVGLIASSFRPSDDATTLLFLIPSNFMAVTSLRKAATILKEVNHNLSLADECIRLADEVHDALMKYAVVDHPKYGKIYAYEVDGFGNHLLMDDANVPSLLAMPYLGDVSMDDPIYQNTRRFVWSEDNPWFFRGKAGEGIGGPHVGYDMVWPMSIIMKAFTSNDDVEIRQCLRMLLTTDAGTGFMHEAFHKDNAHRYTRPWFAWQNTLFGELVLKLIEDNKTDLLIHCLE